MLSIHNFFFHWQDRLKLMVSICMEWKLSNNWKTNNITTPTCMTDLKNKNYVPNYQISPNYITNIPWSKRFREMTLFSTLILNKAILFMGLYVLINHKQYSNFCIFYNVVTIKQWVLNCNMTLLLYPVHDLSIQN